MLAVEFGEDSCEFGNRKRGVFRGYAVRQKRRDERNAVFGDDEIPSGEIRLGPECGNEEVEAPRRYPETQSVVGAGGVYEGYQFFNDHVVDTHVGRFFDAGAERIETERGDERSEYRFDAVRRAGADDFGLHSVARVADFHYRGKAVFLSLGQEERPHVFERVLRGDDEMELRERKSLSGDRDGFFFHAFQKRALGFGVHAVDFVDKHDLGEHRAFAHDEFFGGEVERFAAHDVLRKAVGRSLDAGVRESEQTGEGFGDGSLPHPGKVFDQQVPVRQERDFEKLRDFGFPEYERNERLVEFLEFFERIGHGAEDGSILEKVRDFERKAIMRICSDIKNA